MKIAAAPSRPRQTPILQAQPRSLSQPEWQPGRTDIHANAATPTDATDATVGTAKAKLKPKRRQMMQATGPPLRAAARRATFGVLLVTLLWTLVGIAHPVHASAAEPTGVLEIVTVPAIPGARFTIDGRPHRANSQGVVRIKVSTKARHKISVVDEKISNP